MQRRTGENCCGGELIGSVGLDDSNRAGFALWNKGDKPIIAFALVLTRGERISVHWNLKTNKPVEPQENFTAMYTTSDKEAPVWSVDWVLFADGSSWGADKYGMSKGIVSYRKGRQSAIDRAEELLGYSGKGPGMWFKSDGSLSSGVSVVPRQIHYKDENEYFKDGYEAVIEQLRFDAKTYNRDVSKLVADRLEELESSDSHQKLH